MTRNERIKRLKIVIAVLYTVIVILAHIHLSNMTVSFWFFALYMIIHCLILASWGIMIYVFATSYLARYIIEVKLEMAEDSLGKSISKAKVISYKRHATHITMKFRGCGICVDDFENKKAKIQAAINYTIFGISHAHNDHGTIIVNAIKGCSQVNTGVLYDDEF